jgi:hypothetical protein
MTLKDIILPAAGYVGIRALEWGAVTYCEYRVAKAKADGVENWEDLFWLRMLDRVDGARAERLRKDI